MAKFTLFCVLFFMQVGLAGANPDDPLVQQRVAIQFLVSLGMTNPNIYRHLRNSFGPTAYSRLTVNWWVQCFRQGANMVCNRP